MVSTSSFVILIICVIVTLFIGAPSSPALSLDSVEFEFKGFYQDNASYFDFTEKCDHTIRFLASHLDLEYSNITIVNNSGQITYITALSQI